MLPPHRCCCATLASLLLCMPVPFLPCALLLCMALSHHCCCAALALLLLCRSHLAAAVPLPRGSCCMWRSRITPVVALSIAPLLLWRSRITAAVPLSLGCCMRCMALSHRCCRASLASLRLRRSPLRPALAAAVHGALASLLPCDSHLASWCCGALVSLLQGALASLLPCPSRIAAAVRNLHRRYRAALAWLLLWHSRTAAAASVALLHRCCCGALASLPPCGSCIHKCLSSSRYGFLDRCEAAYTQACWLDVACVSVCGDHL